MTLTTAEDVRQALGAGQHAAPTDGWLAARGGALLRERRALLARLAPAALDRAGEEEVRRLLLDAAHHLQRVRDLAYDEVELELGGSE
jgi:hypothetical protein